MAGWRVHAVMLPDGDAADDCWLTSDGWSDRPIPDAEDLPGRFALPGLVDAHSHVSFGMGSDGPIPLDRDRAEEHRVQWASHGVALIRDAGGAPEVVLSLPQVPGRPYVVAAGRHLAPAGMYFEAVHRPVEPDRLVEIALSELAAGAVWVKLVADFTPVSARAMRLTAPEPTYELGAVRELVKRQERLKQLLPSAIQLGIPVLTGSDVVGSIPREVELLVECGVSPIDALRAATTTAQNFLAREPHASPAAVVTYHVDPREDPTVLAQPAAIVIAGARVR